MTFFWQKRLLFEGKVSYFNKKNYLFWNEIRKAISRWMKIENKVKIRRKTKKSTENFKFIVLNHENDSKIRNNRQNAENIVRVCHNCLNLPNRVALKTTKITQNHQQTLLKLFQPTKANSRIKIPGWKTFRFCELSKIFTLVSIPMLTAQQFHMWFTQTI